MTVSSRWCRACGAEYVAGVEVCRDCGADLFDSPAPPVDHETVTYDFADWTDGQRRVLELLLTGEQVPFSWDATDLVVARATEGKVDELLEQLESLPGEDSPELMAADIAVELTGTTLGRVGTALQYLGAVGVVVGVVEMVSVGQSVAQLPGGGIDWVHLSYILGPFSTILTAALVVGVGALCRLGADWTILRARSMMRGESQAPAVSPPPPGTRGR